MTDRSRTMQWWARSQTIQWVAAAAAIIVALALPFLGVSTYVLNVAVIILIFALFASAWNFLAYSGQASLGHAAFFGIGGYISVMAARNFGLPPFATIFIGGAIAALIGVLIGLTCVRLREWFLAMVTFGFAVIVQTLVVSSLAPVTGGWDGMPAPRLISGAGAATLLAEYYIIFFVTAISIAGIYLILRSRVGIALAAIRENELEARTAGVDPVKYKLFAFGVSTFIAGIAGALEIHHFGYVTPEVYGTEVSFWPVIYSILGGLGTIAGPIIGTIILTLFWDGLKDIGLTYERYIIVGAMLILAVIFLPKGLISLPERVKEWRRRRSG